MAGEIEGLERATWARDHGRALGELRRVLRRLAGAGDGGDAAPGRVEVRAARRQRMAQRVASAMAGLFADPGFVLPEDEFSALVPHARLAGNLFALSAFGSSDPVLEAIAAAHGAGDGIPEGAARLKYLFLWSLDSAREHAPRQLFALEHRLRLPLLVKLLDTKPVSTPRAHRRREELLEAQGRLGLGGLPRGDLEALVGVANACMLCSYAEGPRKHEVKRHLNAALRDWLLAAGFRDAELPRHRARAPRPTLVVASEAMRARHVQYRYFGQWLRQLRRDFRLVLVTEKREIDDDNRALFDAVAGFERRADGSHLREAARLVSDARPDMLFYPSIGMRHWGVALSNLRLAPIQLTALGHSASSFCPQVDYYVVEQGHAGDGSAFTETVALLPDSALRFERQPGLQAPAPRIRASAPVPRIAVPSNALKLNASFLATLARIEQESPRRLEFHFFPNVAGFEGDAVRAAVRAALPRATVWPVLEHAAYLERLNACDMTLSPFPFGGLHSTIDSLSQGLPVVAMAGAQPHARTDATMLRIAGMPGWLCTQDAGAYAAAALRIAGDDGLRVELSRQALGCDVPGRLFGDASTPLGSDVSRMFAWIHANHEAIQASGLRVVRPPGDGDQAAERKPRSALSRLPASAGER